MAQPFKFRHVNTLAGVFVLGCIALLLAGVFVAGRAQGWFEARIRLLAEFTTDEGVYGLQEGAEIRILDALAGRVVRIQPSADGVLQAELEIRERFAGFINRGSQALVKRKIVGLAGDAYVDIQRGPPGYAPFESGDLIPVAKDVEIVETVLRVLDEMQALLVPVVEEAHGVLENLNRITRAIDDGEGTLGMLVRDDETADRLRETVASIHQTADSLPIISRQAQAAMEQLGLIMGEAQATLGNARQISETASVMMTDLAAETDGVRGLIWETTDTVRELGVVTRGLQQHWLLRKHVEKPVRFPLPIPADIGAAGRGDSP